MDTPTQALDLNTSTDLPVLLDSTSSLPESSTEVPVVPESSTNTNNEFEGVKIGEVLKQSIDSISKQYKDNYKSFIVSLPIILILIPLSLFLLSPSKNRGIYLFGAIFTTVFALVFTNNNNDDISHFLANKPSFHGLVLGYAVGYLLMENILLSKLGSMLASGVMGLILCVILTISIDDSLSSHKVLNIGIGYILGVFIGMFFNYADKKTNKNYKDEDEVQHS
tara:strand:+ start:18743 stop:19411 length:669 start_codon:yes stop_codon:yes gene_type:complete